MKRLLSLVCALALAIPLTACGVTSGGLSDPASAGPAAPLAGTLLDEKAVAMAIDAADGIASGVDLMVAGGVLIPGSPSALSVKAALIELRRWLPVAAAAQKAGNAASYAEAMRESAKAFIQIKSALKRN